MTSTLAPTLVNSILIYRVPLQGRAGDLMMSAALVELFRTWQHTWAFVPVFLCRTRVFVCWCEQESKRDRVCIWHCGRPTVPSWMGSFWHLGVFREVMDWSLFNYLYITLLTFSFIFLFSNIIPSAGLVFSGLSWEFQPPFLPVYTFISLLSRLPPPHFFCAVSLIEPPSSSFAWLNHKYFLTQHTFMQSHSVIKLFQGQFGGGG